jgi:hypothetical protein
MEQMNVASKGLALSPLRLPGTREYQPTAGSQSAGIAAGTSG